MTIRQISVFLENKAGHLNKILAVLAQNDININALTVADSSDYGLLRMLVSDPEMAVEILRSENFPVRIHEVISLEMSAASRNECSSRFNVKNCRFIFFCRTFHRIRLRF